MPFISAAQTEMLVARLIPTIQPPDGGETARKIAKAICDWLQFDAFPQMIVNAGIPVVAGAPPGPGSTVSTGTIK